MGKKSSKRQSRCGVMHLDAETSLAPVPPLRVVADGVVRSEANPLGNGTVLLLRLGRTTTSHKAVPPTADRSNAFPFVPVLHGPGCTWTCNPVSLRQRLACQSSASRALTALRRFSPSNLHSTDECVAAKLTPSCFSHLLVAPHSSPLYPAHQTDTRA